MPGASLDDVVDRLDLLIRLTRVANAESIAKYREEILGDSVSDEIYDRTREWQPAGTLVGEVVLATGVAGRTVNRRLADLVERKVLETTGATASLRYRRISQL